MTILARGTQDSGNLSPGPAPGSTRWYSDQGGFQTVKDGIKGGPWRFKNKKWPLQKKFDNNDGLEPPLPYLCGNLADSIQNNIFDENPLLIYSGRKKRNTRVPPPIITNYLQLLSNE